MKHALAILLLLSLAACGDRLLIPRPDDQPYQGPPLSVDSSGAQHVVVAQSPTPGWEFSLERVVEKLGGREVYVTLRRPDPRFVMIQQVVEQRLAVPVESQTPIEVYALVLEHDDRGEHDRYPLAARSAAAPPPSPPPEGGSP